MAVCAQANFEACRHEHAAANHMQMIDEGSATHADLPTD